MATAIRGVARSDDVVARLGGDEFVVLARGADDEAGARLAGRVTDAVDALSVGTRDGRDHAAAPASASRRPARARTCRALLAEADEAMYAAKAGRGASG